MRDSSFVFIYYVYPSKPFLGFGMTILHKHPESFQGLDRKPNNNPLENFRYIIMFPKSCWRSHRILFYQQHVMTHFIFMPV